MNTVIFNRIIHPCVIIDVLADVWVEEVVKVYVNMSVINVWADVVIGTLSDVQVEVTIDVVSDIGVEVLIDIHVNVLVAAMTTLQFPMPAP